MNKLGETLKRFREDPPAAAITIAEDNAEVASIVRTLERHDFKLDGKGQVDRTTNTVHRSYVALYPRSWKDLLDSLTFRFSVEPSGNKAYIRKHNLNKGNAIADLYNEDGKAMTTWVSLSFYQGE